MANILAPNLPDYHAPIGGRFSTKRKLLASITTGRNSARVQRYHRRLLASPGPMTRDLLATFCRTFLNAHGYTVTQAEAKAVVIAHCGTAADEFIERARRSNGLFHVAVRLPSKGGPR